MPSVAIATANSITSYCCEVSCGVDYMKGAIPLSVELVSSPFPKRNWYLAFATL